MNPSNGNGAPILAMFKSRKALVMMLALIIVGVLMGIGKLDSKMGLDFMQVVIVGWMGSQAFEDAAAKRREGPIAVTNVSNANPPS